MSVKDFRIDEIPKDWQIVRLGKETHEQARRDWNMLQSLKTSTADAIPVGRMPALGR